MNRPYGYGKMFKDIYKEAKGVIGLLENQPHRMP
jgi:hypothetical protein